MLQSVNSLILPVTEEWIKESTHGGRRSINFSSTKWNFLKILPVDMSLNGGGGGGGATFRLSANISLICTSF